MGFDVSFPPSESAVFLERVNRFVVRAAADPGELLLHLPNSGRLSWLGEGAPLRYLPRRSAKTAGRVILARDRDTWALLDSALAEAALPGLLQNWGWRWLRAQPKLENRRLDALALDERGGERYLEMKSVTQVSAGLGCFPDAPSRRARAHLELVRRRDGLLLFAVLRQDAEAFSPCDADPEFAAAFCRYYRQGLAARAERARLEPGGLVWSGELPIYC